MRAIPGATPSTVRFASVRPVARATLALSVAMVKLALPSTAPKVWSPSSATLARSTASFSLMVMESVAVTMPLTVTSKFTGVMPSALTVTVALPGLRPLIKPVRPSVELVTETMLESEDRQARGRLSSLGWMAARAVRLSSGSSSRPLEPMVCPFTVTRRARGASEAWAQVQSASTSRHARVRDVNTFFILRSFLHIAGSLPAQGCGSGLCPPPQSGW